MSRALLAVLCLAFGAVASAATLGMPIRPSDEELLTAEGNVAAAVVFENRWPLAGTHAAPPKVRLRIDDIVHGRIAQRTVEATWMPPEFISGNEYEQPGPAWFAKPLSAPPPGTRLIVLLTPKGAEWEVSYRCRYPDTPEIRRRVRKAIADYFAWQRRMQEHDRGVRRYQQVKLREWRSRATPAALARSTADAHFVGIGEVKSLEPGERATVHITEVLKGKPRRIGRDGDVQVGIPVPPAVFETFYYGKAQPKRFVFFLGEVSGDLDFTPGYALSGLGWVIADDTVAGIVRDAAKRAARPRPRCLVIFGGHAWSPAPDAARKEIAEAFVEAGSGHCLVGTTLLRGGSPAAPDWPVKEIRGMFPGTSRALLVSIDRSGGATLSGIRLDSTATTTLFEGETWPPVPSARQGFAQRLMRQLVVTR